jgi:hypothetical protein
MTTLLMAILACMVQVKLKVFLNLQMLLNQMKFYYHWPFGRAVLVVFIIILAFLSVHLFRHSHPNSDPKTNLFKKNPAGGDGASSSAPVGDATRTNQQLSLDMAGLNTNGFPSTAKIASSLQYNQERVVDQSGNSASISPDKQSIVITSRNGDVMLKTNVIAALLSLFQVKSADSLPVAGNKNLGSVQMIDGYLFVTVGRLVVNINVRNGQVRPTYQD